MQNVVALHTESATRVMLVRIKNVYGNELIYPACGTAQTFANLIGAKTFNKTQLRMIQSLGYTIQQAQAQSDALAGP